MSPLQVFLVILCVLGILMHIIALFLLIPAKRCHRIFQREYLIALCVVEIWLCVSHSVEATSNSKDRSILIDIFSITSFTGVILYQYLLLASIAIDKFISIYVPLRYQSLSIKRYTRGLMIFYAFVSFSVTAIFLSMYFYYEKDYTKVYQLMGKCIWLPGDIIISITLIMVYGYFAAVRSKLKQLDAWRHLIVSTAILLSFFLFYLIPDLISIVAEHKVAELSVVFYIMYTLDLICDALSMTLLNRVFRKTLKKKLCCTNKITPQ